LYSGPQVKVRLESGKRNSEKLREYTLSKSILCTKSPDFARTFAKLQEGEEQVLTWHEIDSIVSVRSFEMLIQWLYIGRAIVGKVAPREEISAIVEFVRFADMSEVTGMEDMMSEHIKTIILANPLPQNPKYHMQRDPTTNLHCLEIQHIVYATSLDWGHLARTMFARAAVEGVSSPGGGRKALVLGATAGPYPFCGRSLGGCEDYPADNASSASW
jgi:hypothetical protein